MEFDSEAYTAPTPEGPEYYSEFINISHPAIDTVKIIVRQRGQLDERGIPYAPIVEITLPLDEWAKMIIPEIKTFLRIKYGV